MNEITPVIEMWPIANITPYELNAKKHLPEQVARIVESIRKFGWDQPIVVDRNGVIIKGHGRHLAGKELGLKKLPVWVRSDLTVDQARAARLADNRVAISDIDPEILRIELSNLEFDLVGIFDAKELDFMEADLGEISPGAFSTDMDSVLEEQRRDVDARVEKSVAPDTRISIARAFGFATVSAAGKFAITKLVSHAEAMTGLKEDAALVAFAASLE